MSRRLSAAEISPGTYIAWISGTIRRVRIIQLESIGVWRAIAFGSDREIYLTLRDTIANLLTAYAGTLSDGTRVLFTARLNEMDNFDNDTRSYRSIAEYEFEVSEA